MPMKSSKFGIQSYELCKAQANFVPLFYTGRETRFQSTLTSEEKSKTIAVVCSLVEPLHGKGNTLWMNNFYSAPALAVIYENRLFWNFLA
jgi:hypothetical protein